MSDRFDGFATELFLDDEEDWVAHFVELPNVSACGDTPESALQELQEAWECMKASYEKHGDAIPIASSKRHYSGQFNVRIDRRLHRALATEAARAGISLNALIAQKLSQASNRL